jgi:tRNA threonylcarbamoyladenosine biosynthesis protein TsaB
MILGIETATTVCGAALVRDGSLLAESSVDERNVHSERLLAQIQEVLQRGKCTPRMLRAIAVSIGPGSFTGLRIGLSVAKGIAYGSGVSLLGVPTLLALAEHAAHTARLTPGDHILPALDARRNEVYAQLCSWDGIECRPEGPPADVTVDRLVENLPEGPVYLAGGGVSKILGVPAAAVRNLRVVPGSASRCSAVRIALIGERMAAGGTFDDLATLEPKYIKEFFLQQR